MSRIGTASAATPFHPTPSPAATRNALACVTRGVNAAIYRIGCPLMPDDLRTRIAAALYRHSAEGFLELQLPWDKTFPVAREYWLGMADAVIRELDMDGSVEPARLQERLDNIGRWLHPGLWGAMDGRRGIFLRILAGEQIEPPESARSTDFKDDTRWKADDA